MAIMVGFISVSLTIGAIAAWVEGHENSHDHNTLGWALISIAVALVLFIIVPVYTAM